MKDIYGYLFRLLIGSSFAIVLLYPYDSSAATCEKPIAKAVSVQGSIEAQRVGETQWQQVKLNDTFCPGDKLRSNKKSRAEVALAKSILRLNANTTLTLKNVKEDDTALIDLLQGAAYFFSLAPKSLEVVTPSAIAAVRGTEFFISVEDEKTLLTIFEGEVLASNPAGSLALASGQSAVANRGQAPVQRVVARPQDAVRWTLYYPPVIDIRPGDFQGAVQQSIESYRKGDLKAAFDRLENAPEVQDPRFFTYLASLELSVGRVDAADKNIQQALSLDSKNSGAFALQSIIAVAQNEKEDAFSKAQQAVQADPKSANAQIALSYAQQARFDLEGALTSVQIAVQLEPQNALAWARLAELWSAHGNRDRALEAAQKAVSLNPNLARTQTVLGFAHLTREDTGKARDAFQKAIEFDQGDPLPKLGQGLAKIRDSELAEGRGDIEEAVSLDPNNSLMRSYLGKAYYEEKRSDKASEQFDIAKKKDPKDPTPYLYDAIEKQTTNRPVEALHDLQTAIELNDNRAPFRSRLLLDSDLASRSAAIGRIYTDLGFQKRALLEGWLSVNTDPTNFSAHRLLADSYSSLPRHEIARVSELLQSQLLQPINMTPIQPRLAESNLFLISAGGPGALSFNEFNPLFKSNGLTFQGNGIVAENDTYSGEGIISGIFDRASFSVGYSKFKTNGWRVNADQEDDLANAFVQYQLTPQTSIQAEYRYRDTVKGDVLQRFFENNFFSTERRRDTTNTARIGFHHSFMPGLDVIGNFSYQDKNRQVLNPPFAVIEGDDEAYGGELQFLFRSKYLNAVAGGGFFDINAKDTVNFLGTIFDVDLDSNHTNFYLYTYIKPLKNLTLTVGGSADFFYVDDFLSKDGSQFNPKLGIVWEPFKGTTLRGAWFRALKRTLITNQTVEPTQVAGFNQFFDEIDATDYWVLGGAIDQKFTKSFYGGAQYTDKDLDVGIICGISCFPPQLVIVPWEEKQFRAYLFWTPHEWLSLGLEWLWERLERHNLFNVSVRNVETNYIPLKVNFIHPSGLSVSLKETYVDQQGVFEDFSLGFPPAVFVPGKDEFWLTDLSIKYRFPKRYGFLTIGATNLFDQNFLHFDPDLNNPRIQPVRTLFVSVTLNLT
jgi:tetratricopeptide (TPR) repeat protein